MFQKKTRLIKLAEAGDRFIEKDESDSHSRKAFSQYFPTKISSSFLLNLKRMINTNEYPPSKRKTSIKAVQHTYCGERPLLI